MGVDRLFLNGRQIRGWNGEESSPGSVGIERKETLLPLALQAFPVIPNSGLKWSKRRKDPASICICLFYCHNATKIKIKQKR